MLTVKCYVLIDKNLEFLKALNANALKGVVLSYLVREGRVILGVGASHQDIARWACENVMMRVKSSSWRVYKSTHKASIQDPEIRSEVGEIYKEKGMLAKGQKRSIRPSKRKKTISESDTQKLMKELKRYAKSPWAKSVRIWFTAIKATGLRPSEFRYATIIKINEKPWLRVKNAKTITSIAAGERHRELEELHGRNRGIYRNVPLEHHDQNTLDIVNAQCITATKMAEAGQDVYDGYYNGVRNCLGNAVRNLWGVTGKRVSLYTARHTYKDQMQAKLKKEGYTNTQVEILIAALMGHGSKKTQYAYGVGDEELIEHEFTMSVDGLMTDERDLLKNIVS